MRLGLVSDFGTGLAHSSYIAKRLAAGRFDAVLHLGDVYYAGREEEFANYFDRPLAEVYQTTPFYNLPGNHEYYSGGHSYFRSIDGRRTAHPQIQSQVGSYFSMRFGDEYQVIGIDTDYFGHGRFEDAQLRAWLGEKLQQGRDLGSVNILMSSNELHTIGKPRVTNLFHDLQPFLPSIDLVFWGNDHYCAFFDRTDQLPLASCIGHGGYPYHLKEYGLDEASAGQGSVAPVLYAETGGRYPKHTAMRQELGNNGFVEMTLDVGQRITLMYRDWMGRDRSRIKLAKSNGALVVDSHEAW